MFQILLYEYNMVSCIAILLNITYIYIYIYTNELLLTINMSLS